MQNINRFKELCDCIKHNKIHIIGVLEEEEREKEAENLFEEVVAENFPNLGKEDRYLDSRGIGAPRWLSWLSI